MPAELKIVISDAHGRPGPAPTKSAQQSQGTSAGSSSDKPLSSLSRGLNDASAVPGLGFLRSLSTLVDRIERVTRVVDTVLSRRSPSAPAGVGAAPPAPTRSPPVWSPPPTRTPTIAARPYWSSATGPALRSATGAGTVAAGGVTRAAAGAAGAAGAGARAAAAVGGLAARATAAMSTLAAAVAPAATVATALVGLGSAAAAATGAIVALNRVYTSQLREFSKFNPTLALGEARREVETIFRDMRRAERFAPQLNRLGDANQSLDNAVARVVNAVEGPLLTLTTKVTEIAAFLGNALAAALERLVGLLHMTQSIFDRTWTEIKRILAPILSVLEEIYELLKRYIKWIVGKEEEKERKNLIDPLATSALDPTQRFFSPPRHAGFAF